MRAHNNILRTVPNFPNYSFPTFGYPERIRRDAAESLIVFGPPIHMYNSTPPKENTVHVSGIPDWATMKDVVEIFEGIGKLYSIELSVNYSKTDSKTPFANGWALVTFMSLAGAQNALFAHLSLRIPGMVQPLSIYKGNVNNVVLLKNLPMNAATSNVLDRIKGYPGLISVHFIKKTTARMTFIDLDYALLFMDLVSNGQLIIDGFTSTVEPEDKETEGESE